MRLKAIFNCVLNTKKNSSLDNTIESEFTDLAPVDNVELNDKYSNALSFALNNPRIKNVALTGPYGSGKSSIINTFEKKSDKKFINISLASFKDDNEEQVDSSEIERSILQQMLYGTDSNKLPYSRFKRISTPKHSLVKSIIFVLWLIAFVFFYISTKSLGLGALIDIYWPGVLLLLSFLLSVPIVLISDIHKAAFGIPLKRLSLKNAEIETGDVSENSVLNKHIDEIIYYFQATDYDVVVIEDIDRFENTDIFIKLREINKLINDNEGVKRTIRFLYAVKDDMFLHKNRTKFFDFIIPVVPVVNSSNSVDKVIERLNPVELPYKINKQFIREVSLYIDELRLIHNVINEFIIYYANSASENLSLEKLFAIMIYKNVYPSDFERLHYGEGALSTICNCKKYCVDKIKLQNNEKIEQAHEKLERSESESNDSLRELIDVYIGHIVTMQGGQIYGLVVNNSNVPLNELANISRFEPLLNERNIHVVAAPGGGGNRRALNKSFEEIENDVNPYRSFIDRKNDIENKEEKNRNEIKQEIKRLENNNHEVSHLKLNEIIELCGIDLDEVAKENGVDDSGLLLYLIRNGYLDDSYHLYISVFHEGRLTRNDREYLLSIRNFGAHNPTHLIDTPEEVCANMRDEDFSNKYVLNVILMDYLFDDQSVNSQRIDSALRYISREFNNTEEFYSAYHTSGKNIDKFTRDLCKVWPGYTKAAVDSEHSVERIKDILSYVDHDYISNYLNNDFELTRYISLHGHEIFSGESSLSGSDIYNILIELDVRFDDVSSLKSNPEILNYVIQNSLYVINFNNVNYILNSCIEEESEEKINPDTANYTSILLCENDFIRNYIDDNISEYVENVMLNLPDNNNESVDAISSILRRDEIENETKEKVIEKQKGVFPKLDDFPDYMWATLLEKEKINITWENIIKYFDSDVLNESLINELLDRNSYVSKLSLQKINISESADKISEFLVSDDGISDENYCKLIECLPYKYRDFYDDISDDKVFCLIRKKVVLLTEASYESINHDDDILSELIINNIDDYMNEKDKYPINENVRALLINSNIRSKAKRSICLDVDGAMVASNEQLSHAISDLILSDKELCEEIDNDVLMSVIASSKSLSDAIHHIVNCLKDSDDIEKSIATLPAPYCEILINDKTEIEDTVFNKTFSRYLKKKSLISSYSVNHGVIRIISNQSDNND